METLGKGTLDQAQIEVYIQQMNDEFTSISFDAYLYQPIKGAKYDKVDINKVVEEHCGHLTPNQHRDLHQLLRKHDKLFNDTLRCYSGEPMHTKLEEGVQPVYCRPYPVP